VNSFGKYTSIKDAINALPAAGGEVCILPGLYFEHVLIHDRRDVVLRGCGWQTRIASPSLKPPPPPGIDAPALHNAGAPNPASGTTTFPAVITVSASQHVQLLSFAVEAATDEVGILLDGIGTLSVTPQPAEGEVNAPRALIINQGGRVIDVTIEDLVITASTLPAILAARVTLLQIEANRIAMENVHSRWPAVWVSGSEIRIVHNWVGVRSAAADREWLPVTVTGDLAADAKAGATVTTGIFGIVPLHPGGIQIAGPSEDVFVIENEIDSAGRNGITLGSVSILDGNGNDTGEINGVTTEVLGPCENITLTIPGSKSGQQGGKVVAAGKLINIQINRNRIRNTGLCGIGPVGFFDLKQELEIITIENLTIDANSISRTVMGTLAAHDAQLSIFGYAAVCVPDVENLVIRDNSITDFGNQPGDTVCGIFVLHGQMLEISRNQVLETRDWSRTSSDQLPAVGGLRGGIVIVLATPPTFTATSSPYTDAVGIAAEYTPPVYIPGLPALRVEHNVVRIAVGEALEALGYGPFSIVNNHLATGGMVKIGGSSLAETVLILNLGTAIEAASSVGNYSKLNEGNYVYSSNFASRKSGNPSNGAVLFTNNICELEAQISRRRCFASVAILSLDDLIFSNNQCWLDGPRLTASLDALLAAGSLQVTSNRFQEAAGFPVAASGVTIGVLNITGQNISTYCLFVTGILQPALNVDNISLLGSEVCDGVARNMKLNFKESDYTQP
jgi:hypothetical protein